MRSEILITIRQLSQSTISGSIEAGNGREHQNLDDVPAFLAQRFNCSALAWIPSWVTEMRDTPAVCALSGRTSSYSCVEMSRSIAPQRVPGQPGEFVATEPTSKKHCKQGPIPFALDPVAIWSLPESLALVGQLTSCQPHAEFLDALDSPYSGCPVGAQQSTIRSFKREKANRFETKVNGSGSEAAGFQMHPMPCDHRFAE
jgi:hypothetical protein